MFYFVLIVLFVVMTAQGTRANERNLMVSYLNQWEMICWAVDGGCTLYDFRGVEGYPTEGSPQLGLHRFKQGFGSHFVEFMGQMDLPLRWDWKLVKKTQELYRRIRKSQKSAEEASGRR